MAKGRASQTVNNVAQRTMATEQDLVDRVTAAVTAAGYRPPSGSEALPLGIEDIYDIDVGPFKYPAARYLAERRRKEAEERRRMEERGRKDPMT